MYDGQTGERIGDVSKAISENCHDFSNFCDITRLDDATPNFRNMAMDDVFVPRKGQYGLRNPDWDTRRQKLTYWDF